MMMPRYPDIQVQIHSRNPLALVSAIRSALRKSRVDALEIRRFTDEAMASEEPSSIYSVCASWAEVEVS